VVSTQMLSSKTRTRVDLLDFDDETFLVLVRVEAFAV
jgi:hypothetical protein